MARMIIPKSTAIAPSVILAAYLVARLVSSSFAADVGGKPEKPDVVVTYAQPSGAFTPIWVAYEAGLFKKYGLNASLQLLTPQVSAQAVVSEDADFYTDGPDLINARLRGGQVKYFAGTMQQLVFQIWATNTLKAKESGLNLLVDIGKLNIPAFQVAYGTTEKFLKSNPNTVYAFLKAIAEGVALSRKDAATAKKVIGKYVKIDDAPTIDGTYEAFAPYWAMSLTVRPEAIKGQFEYLDEKEFANAKNSDPKDFYDNSFVDTLAKSGFLKNLGMK